MHRKLYQDIKKDNIVELVNEQVDTFFHGNVLKRYLPFPVWNERDLLVRLYNNFYNKIRQDCIYKVANIQKHGKTFLASILFQNGEDRKYLLSFSYFDDKTIDDQRSLINTILHDYHDVSISEIPLTQEILPEPIQEIIRDLTSRKIDADKLRLKKMHGKRDADQIVSFHELHCLMDKQKRSGISIVAGFQY